MGHSQTTLTREGGQVVQKCGVFVNVNLVEMYKAGERWSKKLKTC